jgi:adenosylcobinamide-GDP ribazoletransferase
MPRIPDPTGQIIAAFGLLTRLPLPSHAPVGGQAAWAWPLVGAVVGGIAGLAGWAAQGLGAGVAAAVMLGVQALVTGAMHEDGLADTADGLGGGWSREQRLAIMKDSHVGSYGVLALVLVGLARWSALAALMTGAGVIAAAVAAGAISRAAMAVMMAAMPPARRGGLAAAVGRPSARVAALAMVAALVIAGLAAGPGAAISATLLAVIPCAALALAAALRIGGQTGDILGAGQQLAETAVLAALRP